MKIVVLIVRLLLGLVFFVFGLNAFLQFLKGPIPGGLAGQFLQALFQSHYVLAIRRSDCNKSDRRPSKSFPRRTRKCLPPNRDGTPQMMSTDKTCSRKLRWCCLDRRQSRTNRGLRQDNNVNPLVSLRCRCNVLTLLKHGSDLWPSRGDTLVRYQVFTLSEFTSL
jgi:hypothetical protein